jgi:hypothetical protein
MSKNKFVPRKVNGKIQRAKTYTPGMDVICVRGPIAVIDTIRSRAKKLDVSISQFISDLVMPKKPAKKKAAKKASKPSVKVANSNGVAALVKVDPKPEASAA